MSIASILTGFICKAKHVFCLFFDFSIVSRLCASIYTAAYHKLIDRAVRQRLTRQSSDGHYYLEALPPDGLYYIYVCRSWRRLCCRFRRTATLRVLVWPVTKYFQSLTFAMRFDLSAFLT